MTQPQRKPASEITQLRAAMRAGNWALALRIAGRFARPGDDRKAIERAHQAYSNPRFYKQLGYDLEDLKAEGRRALIDRYGRYGE